MRIQATAALILAGAGAAQAADVQVTIENTQDQGEFFLTPFWLAFHDGTFDTYDGGELASGFPGITELAEDGLTGPISTAFGSSPAGVGGGVDTTLTATDGPDGTPVFAPGESSSITLDVGDSTVNRYFSYASMVVPSNDLFVGNGDPMAHELFDAAGNFNGQLVIEIYGSDVNDNGTEVNDAFGGAAFSTNGGTEADENNVVRAFFTETGDGAYLDSFVGTGTAAGIDIAGTFGPDDLIARITIVPAPQTAGLLAFGGLMAGRRRR